MIKHLAFAIGLACAVIACGSPEGSKAGIDATQKLDAAKVPEELRPLVPLAERWGIGDDVDRNAKVDRSTPEERTELRSAIAPLDSRITEWLNSFGQGAMSDEAAAFMYMQLAVEEMTAGTP